jgi:hypothetical protein
MELAQPRPFDHSITFDSLNHEVDVMQRCPYGEAVRRNRKASFVATCMVALALLFGQMFACFAEQANLIPCIHECGHSHDSQPLSDSSDGCNPTACHSSFVTTAHDHFVPIVPVSADLCTSDKSFPDGPVREIDYPPQLS